MFLARFCTIVAAETYDCSCKLTEIVQYKYVSMTTYLKTRKLKKSLRAKMNHANSYEEWHSYAEQLDKMKNIENWKEKAESPLYDWQYIKHLKQALNEARAQGDVQKLIHLIRSNTMRNISNILNSTLYCKSYIGTKNLIESFQQEMVACLDYIGSLPDAILPRAKKIEFFAETRHAFGRTGLLFSGGGNIGLYHYGVLRSLFETGYLPRIITGSSVGSIFAGFLGTKKLEDVHYLMSPENIKLEAFYRRNNKYSTLRKLRRLFSEGFILDVRIIQDFMRDNIGDITFQEAYDKTGWILNITVTGHGEHDGYRLLNYLTAPNVLVWSAIAASCGIPYLYGPVDLYCKNEQNEISPYVSGNRKFVDGSIGADLPMQNLSEMFNVNYFIVSQANFWIVPFLNHSEQHRYAKRTVFYKMWELVKDQIAAEIKHRVNQFAMLGILPKALTRYFNLITQQYSGHVTIWPDFTLSELINILDNPTTDLLRHCMIHGSRRVYPKINRIKATLVIERALERNFLKAKLSTTGKLEIVEENLENSILSHQLDSYEDLSQDIIFEQSLQNVKRDRVNSFHSPRAFPPPSSETQDISPEEI